MHLLQSSGLPQHGGYLLVLLPAVACLVSAGLTTATATINELAASTTAHTDLEPIAGTLNYRISNKKGRDNKPWFDGRGLDMRNTLCVRRGRCEKLSNNSCFGAKVPYEYTSLDLTDYDTHAQMVKHLQKYHALRDIPKCWAVIQNFICAVFMPKCEQINDQHMVYLPSIEMCRMTLEPCRIVYNTPFFPEFLRCNETLFPPKCNNDVREMKFNVTPSCRSPLVTTDSSVSFYPGIDGCGLQCKDPLYTDDEHQQIDILKSILTVILLVLTLYVIATFRIDWKNFNKYPAVIVFYIQICMLFVYLGFSAQFVPGWRESIVCRKDGTLRHSEPTAGENLSCTVVFVIIYYFLNAALVWFVILSHAWSLQCHGQERIDKKGSYFHLAAWSIPLQFTIGILALSEVDGNSTVGTCFVGYINHPIRAGFVCGPLCGMLLVSGGFIIRGMLALFRLKDYAKDVESTSTSKKLQSFILNMGVRFLLLIVFICGFLACQAYEMRNSRKWDESLELFITCRFTEEDDNHCKNENRPSIIILQLEILCIFFSVITMYSWCWRLSSLNAWYRYISKMCGKEVVEQVKMPKHKVIAQTWAKRKEFEDKGRLSITLYNTHTDPLGLNFDVNDLNSSETDAISSTWANYLPQFVKRRMALTGAGTTNSSSQGPRKNSLDSEISFSVRHVSVESRRNSVDSQVSVKIAEMKTKVASRTRNPHHHHHHHHAHGSGSSKVAGANNKQRSQRRRDFIASATGRNYNGRRESSTSIESQVIALKKTTYPNASQRVGFFAHSTKKHNSHGTAAGGSSKSMKRRSANAGLDPADISEFLAKNGQFIIPFLQNQGMTTSSEEEEKVQDSRLDAVLKQNLSDEENSMHKGPHIEEIHDPLSATQDRNAAKKQAALETLLKNMQRSNESTKNRNSRNSTRSRQSRKAAQAAAMSALVSANSASRRSQQRKNNKKKMRKDDFLCQLPDLSVHLNRECDFDELGLGDSMSSYSSTSELDIPLGVMLQSSYSGISTSKPNSRSSKTSCDVGIQANAFEIATQTHASYDEEELNLAMRQLNAKNRRKSDYRDEDLHDVEQAADATEMHTLLGNNKYKEATIMSESERLKMLLLPSK